MVDADFHAMGADFIAGSGNKWQCGPPGTGLLYIRNRVLEEHNPMPLPVFWPVASVWYPLEGGLPPRTTGRLPTYDVAEYVQNAGAASLSRMQALEMACEIWQHIGRRQIEATILDLAGYLRDRIVDVFGREALFSPHGDRRLRSGLTTFNPFRDLLGACDERRVAAFVARLEARHGIIVKYVEFALESRRVFGVRVATRLYHTHEDIDAFVDIARNVAAGDA
jgi:selenocysteine lyase/cysteine desulfurase